MWTTNWTTRGMAIELIDAFAEHDARVSPAGVQRLRRPHPGRREGARPGPGDPAGVDRRRPAAEPGQRAGRAVRPGQGAACDENWSAMPADGARHSAI
jgi:hypothetical protein